MRNAERDDNPARLSPLVASLFTARVVATELRGLAAPTQLYPSEAAQCARFAPKRSAEFAAGRLCARRALAELGTHGFPLEANADRSPRWPDGIAGSITHTTGFCAAAVATVADCGSIGVDAEAIGRLTPDVHRAIFTGSEIDALQSLDPVTRTWFETVIFSAKEAFYKCQYPMTRAWRDFHDVTLDVVWTGAQRGDFLVYPAPATSVTDWGVALPLRGRFVIDETIAITGIAAHDA